MPLVSGTKLGPYEIVGPLGAGGMGEVYSARDTRLGRAVALKVLPAELSADPQRRQRLEQEARLISTLSNPHICMLLDVGQQDSIDYLVMERLEGETLRDRLKKGPIPLDQVLRYGTEIADALSTAHRSGIVHRDLKPANVMLTKSGAKLLDFGLARLIRRPPADQATLSRLTTESEGLTEPGTILGTWQYMAPEQLEGSEADVRTDIFALGTVIFEMATGCPAFTGKSKASVIASILSSTPPPVSQFQKICPPLMDHLIRKCLEKDPEQRWQSAHDVASELKWMAETQSEASSGERRRTIRERLFITTTIVALGVVLALAFAYWKGKTEPLSTVHLSLLPPPGLSFNSLTLSPDGRHLAFTAAGTREKQGLWVRSFDSQTAELLPGTQDAHDPFWSPDGSAIAFFTKDKLKRVYPAALPKSCAASPTPSAALGAKKALCCSLRGAFNRFSNSVSTIVP